MCARYFRVVRMLFAVLVALLGRLYAGDTSGYYSNLYVSNTSSHPVAFKVKTTNPERYLVRPNQGVLGAHTENLEVRGVLSSEQLCALCIAFSV
jgi:hypothetical protein